MYHITRFLHFSQSVTKKIMTEHLMLPGVADVPNVYLHYLHLSRIMRPICRHRVSFGIVKGYAKEQSLRSRLIFTL